MRRPRRQVGQYKSTFDTEIGISFDKRPPCGLRRFGLTCLYTLLTPSTTILFSAISTRSTRCDRPRSASSPAITSTRSSFLMCIGIPSNHFRRQADDLREAGVAQLAGHGAEDARAARVLLGVDQYDRVAVEAHVAAVVAARRLLAAHHDSADHFAGLHFAAGHRLLDAGDNHVAQPGVTAARAAQHLDAHAFLGAGVVGHVEVRIHLDHRQPTIAAIVAFRSAKGRPFAERKATILVTRPPAPAVPPRPLAAAPSSRCAPAASSSSWIAAATP